MLVLAGVGLLPCATLAVSQSNEQQAASTPTAKVEEYLGERVVSILMKTTRIEALRVDPKAQQEWSKGPAKEVDTDSTAKLVAVLLNEDTYRWEGDSPIGLRCIFEPGVAYRFWKDKEVVSVLVCFKCSEVKFVSDNPEDKGDPFRRAIYAKLRPEIVQLTKQAFPNDKDIQALKE